MSRPRVGRCRRGAATPQRGFSLIEVLVAFVILALMLGALFEVFSQGLRAARQGDAFTRAVLLAQAKLAEIRSENSGAEGVSNGEFGDEYRWQARKEPYEAVALRPTAGVRALSLEVEVSWNDGWRDRSVVLSTMYLAAE